jgi:phage terminase small subunit
MKSKALNPKELKFAERYADHGDLRKAAAEAGFAERAGYRLRNHPAVLAKLEALSEEMLARALFTREKKLKELEDIKEKALEDVEYPNYPAALKAIELQCKMAGHFDSSGNDLKNVNITVAIEQGGGH